ncbi:MAG: hypothetical protein ABIN15_00065 [candidate division WOR-3 bacterium]
MKDEKPENFLKNFKKFTLKIVITDYYRLFKESKVFKTKWEKAYILQRKEEDEIFKGYKKTLREDIRRAKKNNLIFRELSEKDLKNFYDIYLFTFRKIRAKPLPFSFIENLYKKLKNSNLSNFYGVFKDDKLFSALIVLYPDEKTVLAFIQGTSGEGYHLNASPFLFHNAILYEFKKGREIFSFGAVPEKKESLIFFKERFGAEEYSYPVYLWYNPWYVED